MTKPAQFCQYGVRPRHEDFNMANTENKIPHGVAGAPNEASLLDLMNRTGYSMIQENGQRKYGGPPPTWEGAAPSRGCEIFVGKIPRDCYEDELVPVFEKIGRIYELRLMMDFSGTNRGYCFVMYTSKADAKRAVRELNNYELRKGRYLGVCLSVDNCRLFVGGIPKNKAKEEILTEMRKVTEGVVDVIVYPSAMDKAKNRGFAFVEYDSHRAAAMARRKLIPGRIQLFGHQIAVDWAEPEAEVDEDIMAKVKILYIRNLMLTTTEDHLRELCQKVAGKEGSVERVKKMKDYAFVHFREREDALAVMDLLDGTNIEGSVVEVVLAKPVDKNDYVRYTRGAGRGGALAQTLGYGTPTTVDYQNTMMAAYLNQYPGTVGMHSPATAGIPGMAPVPTHSGFQNRGALSVARSSPIRGRGRGAAGVRGTGGRSYLARQGTTSYRKNPLEMLEDYCSQNGLGTPVFQLMSTMSGDGQLFLYKVSIPAMGHSTSFQPDKLCRTIEEAKQFASQYVLVQLGAPMEGIAEVAPSPTGSATALTSQSLANTAALYQGRPIGPAAAPPATYALSNGLMAGTTTPSLHAPTALTPQTLMSPISTAAAVSYAMAPSHSKMIQSMQTMQQRLVDKLNSLNLQSAPSSTNSKQVQEIVKPVKYSSESKMFSSQLPLARYKPSSKYDAAPHMDTTYDPYAAAAAFTIPAYQY